MLSCPALWASAITTTTCQAFQYGVGPITVSGPSCLIQSSLVASASFSLSGNVAGDSGSSFTFTVSGYAGGAGADPVPCSPTNLFCGGTASGSINFQLALATLGSQRAGFAKITLYGVPFSFSDSQSVSTVSAGPYSCLETASLPDECAGTDFLYNLPPVPVTLGSTVLPVSIVGGMNANAPGLSGEMLDTITVQFFEADGTTPAQATVVDPGVVTAPAPEPSTLLLVSAAALALIGRECNKRHV